MPNKGFKHTKESIKKMSEAKKGKPSPRKGCKLTKDQIRKMSEVRKGKHYSPKTEFKKGQCGEKAGHWKGGRKINRAGYVLIYMPEHPFAMKDKCVLEHRLIAEKHLGRYLARKEVVHHINGTKDDNRIENLMVFKNGRYHYWFHKKGSCSLKGITLFLSGLLASA